MNSDPNSPPTPPLADEFAPGVFDEPTELSRRETLKLMAASLMLSLLPGCGKQPSEEIVGYVRKPEGQVAGRPRVFSTTLTRGREAIGVLVESHEGRPTKIEGNPDHPASLGATDLMTQAAVLSLCDPDRSQAVRAGDHVRSWEEFTQTVGQWLDTWRANDGQGVRLLTGAVTSPTMLAQIALLRQRLPNLRWHTHEPIDYSNARDAATLVFGHDAEPVYRFDQAQVIVSLDSDFLFALPGSVRYARDFMGGRRMRVGESSPASMNRLYVVEPSPTLTGAKADHRLPLAPRQVGLFARHLAARFGLTAAPSVDPDAEQTRWLDALVADLRAAGPAALVIAGHGQPAPIHALAYAVNAAIGSVGRCVQFIPPVAPGSESLQSLTRDMAASRVDTLIVVDANPVYDAPADLAFGKALGAVHNTVHMGLYLDETARACHWHVPMAHPLESWGDARAYDGTASLAQPLIAPLYDGRSPTELMALLLGQALSTPYDLVRAYWRSQVQESDFEGWWVDALRVGLIPRSASRPLDVVAHLLQAEAEPSPQAGPFELVVRPDYRLWDGRHANNAWLQETPDPLSKLTWDNAAWFNPTDAGKLDLSNQDLVELTHDGRTITAAVWVMPGQAAGTISLALGHGRTAAGTVGQGAGVSAYRLRPADAPWSFDVTVQKTGRRYPLACTQRQEQMEGRGLYRTGGIEEFHRSPEALVKPEGEPVHLSLFPARPENEQGQQWGMSIDLTACIGCNACSVACQAENNIPVVGKEEVIRGRHMNWIRIDRYFEGPDIRHQPVPCMQCEDAPCELVCPVGATQHSHDGLNDMVYNRCIGTRYCSNNCPYKVRRFNFLQYSDWDTPALKLQRNPDVSVRPRGVMEKCTYCVQRIREAEIDADVQHLHAIPDGRVQTACQQVCPTRAITFGDIRDPRSRVTGEKSQPHNYSMLEELNTRPRTTYLAQVRNPNPALAT